MTATILADSISEDGIRLITLELYAPKFLDAEFEKHRMISSNSSSDRAVPWHKLSEGDHFVPTDVRAAGPGMQNESRLSGDDLHSFQSDVRMLRNIAIKIAGKWVAQVHKQHLNRYLLPWSCQRKVATATEDQWQYFLGLRLHSAADPAMQQLAQAIDTAIKESTPSLLRAGEWHLPYVLPEERENPLARDLSVARCARVSYLNHDQTKPDVGKDRELALRLNSMGHWSCFEHQATPMDRVLVSAHGITHMCRKGHFWSSNFRGWVQWRKMIDGTAG